MGMYSILTLVDNNLLTIANITCLSDISTVISVLPCPKHKHVFNKSRQQNYCSAFNLIENREKKYHRIPSHLHKPQ